MRNVILIFLLTIPMYSIGQVDPACFVRKYFLLIQSSSDYKAALQTAKNAAKELNIKLDLRGLIPDKNPHIGLSLPADTCIKYSEEEGGDGDSSCYMARGRWDDGVYISVEYSNAYDGFSKGEIFRCIHQGQ